MIRNKKGFGVEDAPFMILAAVAVMMLVVWIGINVMLQFVEGNEHQAAVEASTEVYKRAKLLSLGYDESSDRLRVSVPNGYAIRLDGAVVALGEYSNESPENATKLTEPMSLRGVVIAGEGSNFIGPGEHDLILVYSKKDEKVVVSWE